MQEYVPSAVIAGSFPLAHELWQQQQQQHGQQHGQQQWQQQQQQHEQNLSQGPMFQPSDIDIFVFAEGDMDSVEEVYISHVVARLQGSVRVVRNDYMWHASFLSDDGSASEDEQRQDEQRRQRAQQTPNVVRREIKAWVADYARITPERVELACGAGGVRDPIDDQIGDLYLACSNLPSRFCHPPYRVVSSHVFRLVANDYHTRVPSTLLQVNVILVSTTVLDKYSSPAHLICAGFDLTPCQVVVAVDARREYICTRLEAVSSRSPSRGWLELTPCAFTMAHKYSVCVQMRRVMKYIDRGFRFSCREPHDGDVLVEILQSRPSHFLCMPGAEWPDVMARRNALGNNAPDERERNAPAGETWDADSSASFTDGRRTQRRLEKKSMAYWF